MEFVVRGVFYFLLRRIFNERKDHGTNAIRGRSNACPDETLDEFNDEDSS
jgi:hypothetical protein